MKNVLIADDSTSTLTLLTTVLKKKNVRVETAVNGEEAVQKFKESSPDIVFLDTMMPKMNGLEALREIKSLNPNSIVVMLTALSSTDDIQEASDAGANEYLQKPFQIQNLFSILKKYSIIE